MNGEGACTTLMPEISLDAKEKRVETPEWIKCLRRKSIVIAKVCKKSNPKIGLKIWAIKKMN